MVAPRTVLAVAFAGTLLVTAYAVFATVQILVLNPLATVPGTDLGQIHAGLTAAGESSSWPPVAIVLGLGVALALLVLVLVARRRDGSVTAVVCAYLCLLAFGAPAYFVASFGPGMALADAYLTSGGDHSRWSLALYATSGLALLGVLAVAVGMVTTRRGPGGSEAR